MANTAQFAFGKNWQSFLGSLTERQVSCARESLARIAGELHGKTFLDIGCGSGIHSLAAVQLGASRVHSFDKDADSLAATIRLRSTAPTARWTVECGSALNREYMQSLGQFDVVYAWVVLHHTGDLWAALDAVTIPVADQLIISIYNDQGVESKIWHSIKRKYNRSGVLGRRILEGFGFLAIWGRHEIASTLKGHPGQSVRTWRNYAETRGMSPWTDLRDWIGGYPFEVATPQAIRSFFQARGFSTKYEKTCGNGRGCNEFLFRRITASQVSNED